jgi:phosphoribosylanthranilate isomerase
MTPCVKICGLCRPEDVLCAVAAGADCVGFVLYEKSPRYVSPERLGALAALVPAGVQRVGVVVNATPAAVAEAVRVGRLDVIQFHGDETDLEVAAFHLASAWRVVNLHEAAEVERAVLTPGAALVVDVGGAAGRGGTGTVCDWALAAQLAQRRRVLLAGGLRPENVAEALRQVQPWGVDVSSGVEAAPGIKDHDRVRRFVAAARGSARALQETTSCR